MARACAGLRRALHPQHPLQPPRQRACRRFPQLDHLQQQVDTYCPFNEGKNDSRNDSNIPSPSPAHSSNAAATPAAEAPEPLPTLAYPLRLLKLHLQQRPILQQQQRLLRLLPLPGAVGCGAGGADDAQAAQAQAAPAGEGATRRVIGASC